MNAAQSTGIRETRISPLTHLDFDKTSPTEVRHQMRSGDLPAYMIFNYLSNGIELSFSWYCFTFLVLFR